MFMLLERRLTHWFLKFFLLSAQPFDLSYREFVGFSYPKIPISRLYSSTVFLQLASELILLLHYKESLCSQVLLSVQC